MATGKVSAGDVFNNWTVLSQESPNENGEQYFLCLCICGTQRPVRKGNLGKVTGCGCTRKKYQASNTPRKVKKQPAKVPKQKPAALKKAVPVAYEERTKSPREQLEDRLDQHRLERELNELWVA